MTGTRVAVVAASAGALACVPAVASEAPPPRLDLSPAVIERAIADSRDAETEVHGARTSAFGAGPTSRIDQRFRDAELGSCLGPGAVKFEPPSIGPIALGGVLVLPFWAHAIASGRCRF